MATLSSIQPSSLRGRYKGTRPNATARTSKAVKDAADKKLLTKPILVKGIGPGKLIIVTTSMFKHLDIDPFYQRGETLMINKIGRALDAGGLVLDPATLCKRKDTGDTLWIVDGHQRICAFIERKMPFSAIVHESEGKEAEADFFVALNSKNNVSPNVLVKASNTRTAKMIMSACESLEHPLNQRINFEQFGNDRRYEASLLARSLAMALGVHTSMPTPDLLSRLDAEVTRNPTQKVRAEQYLRLIGHISVQDDGFKHLPHLVLRAIGAVARKRWERSVKMPNKGVINRLRKKDWASSVVLVSKYFPILVAEVEKIWREE